MGTRFVFEPDGLIQEARNTLERQVRAAGCDPRAAALLVLDHLQHHGHLKAAKAFAKASGLHDLPGGVRPIGFD